MTTSGISQAGIEALRSFIWESFFET